MNIEFFISPDQKGSLQMSKYRERLPGVAITVPGRHLSAFINEPIDLIKMEGLSPCVRGPYCSGAAAARVIEHTANTRFGSRGAYARFPRSLVSFRAASRMRRPASLTLSRHAGRRALSARLAAGTKRGSCKPRHGLGNAPAAASRPR